MRNTKVPALPSMIGTSSPETSTYALSMPRPAKADMRCSTVETRVPSFSSTVASVVLPTLCARAGMAGLPARSERQNTIPVSMAAGRSAIVTLRPVCRPTPVARTDLHHRVALRCGAVQARRDDSHAQCVPDRLVDDAAVDHGGILGGERADRVHHLVHLLQLHGVARRDVHQHAARASEMDVLEKRRMHPPLRRHPRAPRARRP